VYFDRRWHAARVAARANLRAGSAMRGPAIIEEYGATTVVPPGWTVKHGRGNCLLLTR
jgi:N-methylhydantoinase A/oxoprolinase/acetone carboxylase beta subunit